MRSFLKLNAYFKFLYLNLTNYIIQQGMYPYTDKVDQGLLDTIYSQNRQIFYALGKQTDQQRQNQMLQLLRNNRQIINTYYPQQKYKKLLQQQEQLRKVLDQTEKVLLSLKRKQSEDKLNIEQLTKQKQQYLTLIRHIKTQHEMMFKSAALRQQIQLMGLIKVQNNNLDGIDLELVIRIKDILTKLKEKVEGQKNLIIQNVQKTESQIIQIKKRFQTRLAQKLNYQREINYLKGFRITRKKEQKFRIKSNNLDYEVDKKIIKIQPIRIKSQIPNHYYIWSIILVVWAVILGLVVLKRPWN